MPGAQVTIICCADCGGTGRVRGRSGMGVLVDHVKCGGTGRLSDEVKECQPVDAPRNEGVGALEKDLAEVQLWACCTAPEDAVRLRHQVAELEGDRMEARRREADSEHEAARLRTICIAQRERIEALESALCPFAQVIGLWNDVPNGAKGSIHNLSEIVPLTLAPYQLAHALLNRNKTDNEEVYHDAAV